jgi:hypothetical protein
VQVSARLKIVGNTLFALYTDHAGSMTGRTWLLEARMLGGGQLVGSWVQAGNPRDAGPFIGRIVDDERMTASGAGTAAGAGTSGGGWGASPPT